MVLDSWRGQESESLQKRLNAGRPGMAVSRNSWQMPSPFETLHNIDLGLKTPWVYLAEDFPMKHHPDLRALDENQPSLIQKLAIHFGAIPAGNLTF